MATEPLVFDGVGRLWTYDEDGNLQYNDDKINSVTFQPSFNWNNVFGGESGLPFHLTAQDLADKLSIEVPRYSPSLAKISQGADNNRGDQVMDEFEDGFFTENGYQLEAMKTFGGSLVEDSVEVWVAVDDSEVRKKLERVATSPTTEQYTVDTDGLIKSAAANKDKPFSVTFKRNTSGSLTGFSGKRRPTPIKLIHRFELLNDVTRKPVQIQLTVYRCVGMGTLDATAQRKNATTTTLEMQILDPPKTPDNPKGYAATMIIGV